MKKIFILLALFVSVATTALAAKQTIYLYVPNMECNNCKGKVENVLAYEKGVRKLDFDIQKRLVTIVFEDKKTDVEKLQAALIKHLNYKSMVVQPGETPEHHHDHDHNHEGHSHDHNHKH